MELNEYQIKAMSTCMVSCENFSYMFLNLVGEVGEFASKIAKAIRKSDAEIIDNRLVAYTSKVPELNKELMMEAGDILWQISSLCSIMGWDLEEIAQMNLDKLKSRQERCVIDGNGDNR